MPSVTITVSDLELSGPVLDVQLGDTLVGRQALQRHGKPTPAPLQIRAMVDTGADMSVIDKGVAFQLQLTLIGFQILGGGFAGGPLPGVGFVPEYAAHLLLPNSIEFDFTAIEISLPAGLQMLIGRDLLAKGQFHYQGLSNSFTLTF